MMRVEMNAWEGVEVRRAASKHIRIICSIRDEVAARWSEDGFA